MNTYYLKQHPKMNVFIAYVHNNNNQHNNKMLIPGTATKNLTASLWPWKDNCAWAMEQYGVKVAGVTLSVRVLLYTRMTPPGRPPPDEAPPGPLLVPITDCLLPGHREGSVYFQILKTKRLYTSSVLAWVAWTQTGIRLLPDLKKNKIISKFCLGLGCLDTDRDVYFQILKGFFFKVLS